MQMRVSTEPLEEAGISLRRTFVLAPLAIARRLVVYPRQELEVVDGHLGGLDAELLVELADRRTSHALNRLLQSCASLSGNAQRVRAACVCPHVRECNLLGRSLLEEESVLGVEEEDGEGAVEEAFVDVLHQVACGASGQYAYGYGNKSRTLSHSGRGCMRQLLTNFLACASDRLVVVVQYNADLVHQFDLLLIVAGKHVVVAGGLMRPSNDGCVDIGEKLCNIFRCDFRVIGDGSGRAHVCDWYTGKRRESQGDGGGGRQRGKHSKTRDPWSRRGTTPPKDPECITAHVPSETPRECNFVLYEARMSL
jgi:hypothetical protein